MLCPILEKMKNKRQLRQLLIFGIILISYFGLVIYTNVEWKNSLEEWRQFNIKNSPTVYVTRTGEKYHNAYHYHNRNSALSLFEAYEEGYSPCHVCRPPSAPTYSGKPDKPPFYFYNWFIISVLFSALYWTLITLLNKRHNSIKLAKQNAEKETIRRKELANEIRKLKLGDNDDEIQI